jgi:hypothetical protein
MNWAPDPSPVEQIVVDALRVDRDLESLERRVGRVGADRVLGCAKTNKVSAAVSTSLRDLGEPWASAADEAHRRAAALYEGLAEVGQHIGDPRWGLIEAAGVVAACGRPWSELGSGDVDVVVASEVLPVWHRVLVERGFISASRTGHRTNRTEFVRDGVLPQRIAVSDACFDRVWLPLAFEDLAGTWVERTVEAPGGLRVLETTDLLVQVALHTSLHSFVRSPGLRLHLDVDRMARQGPDWGAAIAQLRAAGGERRAWVSMAMARELLGTPIDSARLEQLRPPGIVAGGVRRLLRGASVFAGGRKLTGPGAVLLDVAVDDRGARRWLRDAILPPSDWLASRYGPRGPWRLQALRYRDALTRWRPQ